ncbi:hypothetical protein MAPG_00663 [Magnaporthiopsis poae ATCC 64411]|uniref:DNA-directed RNA polymerase III subunit RPC3 n=1 Tax=Magnaporthiopsis poae (strain ATCC 64411 / 73-15) TaxID=644358 RepID=A0A0C4DLL9_MAGP6|nr:hypothetical protein MAPG_00663 [Magnaporthiopsis poae ATCC 64411]
MFVTKHLAELCALFIDDVYGELPSRIFSILLTRGRSTVQQLVQYTSLSPRQLRHGLAVLIQHNLLYYSVGSVPTTYEANAPAAYNLIRAGRVLELVGSMHGEAAKDVIQSLMVLGNTKVGDLRDAYAARIKRHQAPVRPAEDAEINGNDDPFVSDHEGDQGDSTATDLSPVESVDQFNSILCRLVEDELLVVVGAKMFQSFDDIYRDVQVEVQKKEFTSGIKGTKDKERYQNLVAQRLSEIRDEGKKLKRKLETQPIATKRRKIQNGDVANGTHDIHSDPPLDPDAVLRVNHEKCLVELRNRRLTEAVADHIGETTSQIYAVLLSLLTAKLSRCRDHPIIDANKDEDDSDNIRYVTTNEVFDHLSPSLDVGSGIGRVDASQVDPQGVERIRRRRPRPKEPYVNHDGDDDDGDDDDDDGGQNGNGAGIEYDEELERYALKQQSEAPAKNGMKESKVKFKETKTSESRLSLMRQHLLLLCESSQGFLRHSGNGQWTVDFRPLVRRIQESELDTVIERKIGRHSLRLIRILRKRGKADEKSLPMQAMMAKGTVHKIMLEMQMHGFVDVQEVPKDNTRNAKSTIFLWFCDTDLSLSQLLDNTYKTMLRCLQVREVHRQNAREVLRFVGRADVKGREKEALEKKYFDRYDQYRNIEDKILGHVMRLDDLVGVLSDY